MIEITDDREYITYLKINHFPFKKDYIITSIGEPSFLNKPDLAFWGSPLNASYGWKDWCEDNNFGNYYFTEPIIWKIEPGYKILRIEYKDVVDVNTSILSKYVIEETKFMEFLKEYGLDTSRKEYYLNFSKMIEDEIVAVELMDSSIGHLFLFTDNSLEQLFNTWDCESIVVLDESKILIRGEDYE